MTADSAGRHVVYAGLLREGIYRTTDGGRRWRSVTNFPVLAGEAIMTFAVSILSLADDPRRPGSVYAGTSFSGLLATSDGGLNWRARNAGLEGRASGDLAYLISIDALAVSPARPATLYAGVRSRGVYRSSTGGRLWVATAPLPATDIRTVAAHPSRPGVVYVGTLGGGVHKSVDGGARWRAMNRGLANRLVQRITVHPTRPWVVFAATHGGLFKSVDGGRRWRPVHAGLASAIVHDLAVHPRKPRVLYAATKGAGVFRSTDGGNRWRAFNAGLTNRLVVALAVDSGRPARLYAGTLGGLFVRRTAT